MARTPTPAAMAIRVVWEVDLEERAELLGAVDEDEDVDSAEEEVEEVVDVEDVVRDVDAEVVDEVDVDEDGTERVPLVTWMSLTINDVFVCRVTWRLCNAAGKPVAKNVVT